MPFRVFISSTSLDLPKHRLFAAKAIRQMGMEPICMEDFGAAADMPIKHCVQQVQRANAYVGVFGWRYGFIDADTGLSATEVEYRAAKARGMPLLPYLLADDHPVLQTNVDRGDSGERILALRKEIRQSHLVQFVKDHKDFTTKVTIDLHRLRRRNTGRRSQRSDSPALEPMDTYVTKVINPHHPYCLDHTVTRLRKKDSEGRPRFQVRIFITVYENNMKKRKQLLQGIDRVVYQLHPSNNPPVAIQQNWREYFRLELNNWGEFWIRGTIIFKDRDRAPIQMIRHLNLEDPEPILN